MAKKPKKLLVDRIFDFLFGPDDDEAVDDALRQDEDVQRKGAVPLRKADYVVEVVYDREGEVFNARLKTKTADLDINAEGETPGDALSFVGMLIDASLVRRGFRRGKTARLDLKALGVLPSEDDPPKKEK